MLGPVLLAAARSDGIRRLVSSAPVTRPVVNRFVAGEQLDPTLEAVRLLTDSGLDVTLDHLGEDITDRTEALRNRDAYLSLAQALAGEGLGPRAEMSVKLSAFGQALPDGHDIALANVLPVVEAAAAAGTTVTLDMEDHTTVDSTLAVLAELRKNFPQTGAVLQSYLFRTEGDCHALAGEGSRVRLVKGAYNEPATVAHQNKADVDRAYVRCLKILLSGKGYPMIGSHDPRMVVIAQELARRLGRKHDEFEFQMLYGIREAEQQRLAAEGHRMRVYVPYGTDWYGYFMRRLAERPANLGFFLRSLATRG
ncbi:proline dehydrogenase family protein [Streptomyces albidus (ex Kaewkla and Franco 2022)]|uniref:proline dehydrogenase family protein n=1 Tax=Streptomyces albidus (ex Kaewkla and Franco 2022) TaxID=722709 RepID=UPI0015EE5231|nr:proline dehydrogenase family protein [Streptomyces albidus (ex Kaewkla and Franco 2022)]